MSCFRCRILLAYYKETSFSFRHAFHTRRAYFRPTLRAVNLDLSSCVILIPALYRSSKDLYIKQSDPNEPFMDPSIYLM